MNQLELTLIVVAQIVVFQFVSLGFARAVSVYLVGAWALPDQVAKATEEHRWRAVRFRCLAGGLLLLATAATASPGVLEDSHAKLALAAISLISSALMIAGFVYDRVALGNIAATLPEPRVRVAALERHTIATYYAPLWELAPPAVLMGTIGMIAWALPKTESATLMEIAYAPLAQLIWILSGLAMVMWKIRVGGTLSQRARTHLGSAERSAMASESLKKLELQFFLLARIVVTILIGLNLDGRIAAALGPAVPDFFSAMTWALVAMLLLAFAVFMILVSALKSKLLRQVS